MPSRLKNAIPRLPNVGLSLLSAVLLTLSFPDFEFWWLAWFALVPFMIAVDREASSRRSFLLGWLFGTSFFMGTGWWLTYAPIHYASIPWPIAYGLILIVCLITGIFPAIFAAILSRLVTRFGSWAFLAAPFVWVFSEFARYWLTGNNWNAIGYSQAFSGMGLLAASAGGVSAVNLVVVFPQAILVAYWTGYLSTMKRYALRYYASRSYAMFGEIGLLAEKVVKRFRPVSNGSSNQFRTDLRIAAVSFFIVIAGVIVILLFASTIRTPRTVSAPPTGQSSARVIAIQPNVPMSGMDYVKSDQLRSRQIATAEDEIKKLPPAERQLPTLVILPESPMNFMYADDREFQHFVGDFARRNNVSVLFNSAEPDKTNGKYFNSAVMVGPDGREVSQYDKIYLLPFGEAVPAPLDSIVPGFVGNFSYGREYDLLPVGDARAGVMICFESHFGALSREYVRNGADVLIEMTNDGYLGPTPVLRQHLANAVFRAVETNRPVLRVTNVGVTAYITETGGVIDPAPSYAEATRTWSVSKSDGSQTFYVKYGDWFAWLCTVVTVGLLILTIRRRQKVAQVEAA